MSVKKSLKDFILGAGVVVVVVVILVVRALM